MTRNFTIHVAQHDKTATVWQVLEFGKCVVYFSTLRGQTRRDAERWVVANRDTGQVEFEKQVIQPRQATCPLSTVCLGGERLP